MNGVGAGDVPAAASSHATRHDRLLAKRDELAALLADAERHGRPDAEVAVHVAGAFLDTAIAASRMPASSTSDARIAAACARTRDAMHLARTTDAAIVALKERLLEIEELLAKENAP